MGLPQITKETLKPLTKRRSDSKQEQKISQRGEIYSLLIRCEYLNQKKPIPSMVCISTKKSKPSTGKPPPQWVIINEVYVAVLEALIVGDRCMQARFYAILAWLTCQCLIYTGGGLLVRSPGWFDH